MYKTLKSLTKKTKKMNKIKITDLRIGDIVCNPRTKFPMRVVGIYEDGTVYLDFDGNEGDFFEENCKDLEFAEKKPVEAEYNKCFYNQGTERTYKTLKEAKLANVKAVVYRCWLLDGDIKGMTALKAYGTQVCTIKNADKRILDAIGSGTVGVGFKDKRMC